jgi:hypothetical protein
LSRADQEFIDFVEAAIRAHVAQQPSAADTLEGIHQWWIDWQGMPGAIELTERALERLKAAGVVECVQMGRRVLWRAARAA